MLIFDMVIDNSAIEIGSLYVIGKTKIAVAEMGDHLATIDTRAEKWGFCCAPFRGAAGSPI